MRQIFVNDPDRFGWIPKGAYSVEDVWDVAYAWVDVHGFNVKVEEI